CAQSRADARRPLHNPPGGDRAVTRRAGAKRWRRRPLGGAGTVSFALLAALGVLALSVAPAASERLIASISNHRVMVTSSFTGDELVLFGGIEPDATSRSRRGGYDLVVTVSGPRQSLVTYRKGRMLGIWVNADSRVFENAPSYYAVLSNRPLDAIA